MSTSKYIILKESKFLSIKGQDNKDFLQGIITNDINKCDKHVIYSCLLSPQGKFLSDFFVIPYRDSFLIEINQKFFSNFIDKLNLYKLRSKIEIDEIHSLKSMIIINNISEKNLEIGKIIFNNQYIKYVDPRNINLGAKIISKLENIHLTIKKLNLTMGDKKKYYNKSFQLGIPQMQLDKLRDKIFGIENNLDELKGIDFKKGCYVGQENTSRIKLRNKLRRRILPVQKVAGEISENQIIKYKGNEIGKIMISKPYSFALIKVVDPDLNEFNNKELACGNSKIKILKPDWI